MKQQNVYLFVFDGLSDWEMGYAVAGINNPKLQFNPCGHRLRTVSSQRASILTVGGVRIETDLTLDHLSPEGSALLILPVRAAWDSGQNIQVVDVARDILMAE
jgi:hypothetical protein